MNPFSEKLYSYEEQKNLLYNGGCLSLDVLTVDKIVYFDEVLDNVSLKVKNTTNFIYLPNSFSILFCKKST